MCGNAGWRQLTGGYTPGPSEAEKQAMRDAPRLAQEAADAKANSKLASRNRRVASSILATGAGTGAIQPLAGKTQLGA